MLLLGVGDVEFNCNGDDTRLCVDAILVECMDGTERCRVGCARTGRTLVLLVYD